MCKELSFLDMNPAILRLRNESIEFIQSPTYLNRKNQCTTIYLPSVNLYEFKDCTFKTDSSNFLSGTNLIVERLEHVEMKISDYSTGFLKYHNDFSAIIHVSDDVVDLEIDQAYYLGGNGSWNYYHWMTEILPKLEFIATQQGFERCHELIFSSEVLNIDAFKKTLLQALAGYCFKVHFLNPEKTFKISSLLIINKPSDILFNSKNILSRMDFSYYRKQSLDYVKNLVFEMLTEKKFSNKIDRVFLARKEGAARTYNQKDVANMLVNKFNFETIYLEDYSIEEQACIFNNAKYIVGPSGAAWTNVLFCNPSVTLISWLPTNLNQFSGYSSLARSYNLNMFFIEANPEDNNQLHTSYFVSCEDLKNIIKVLVK